MHKQAGNALFLVLIGVALFAALSYAVTQSGRDGGNIDREKAAILAADILQYSSKMKIAVKRMRMFQDCEDEEISFENESTGSYYSNSNAPEECELFNPDGGGFTYNFPEEASTDTDWKFTGSMKVVGVGYDPAGAPASAKEIIALIGDIDEEVCLAINRSLGIKSGPPVPEDYRVTTSRYTGSFSSGGHSLGDDAESAILAGHQAGCVLSGYYSPGTLYFYQVLVPR